jgi:hypothetical protein
VGSTRPAAHHLDFFLPARSPPSPTSPERPQGRRRSRLKDACAYRRPSTTEFSLVQAAKPPALNVSRPREDGWPHAHHARARWWTSYFTTSYYGWTDRERLSWLNRSMQTFGIGLGEPARKQRSPSKIPFFPPISLLYFVCSHGFPL